MDIGIQDIEQKFSIPIFIGSKYYLLKFWFNLFFLLLGLVWILFLELY